MDVLAVAEDLANEFVGLPSSYVVRAVVRCVDEFPSGSPHFIAQAARATAGVPRRRRPLSEQDDVLDVSLHDHELHEEVVLTAHLIIAANESETRLSLSQVDRILGVGP